MSQYNQKPESKQEIEGEGLYFEMLENMRILKEEQLVRLQQLGTLEKIPVTLKRENCKLCDCKMYRDIPNYILCKECNIVYKKYQKKL